MMDVIPRMEGSLPKMEDRKHISNRFYHADIILYVSSHFTPPSEKVNKHK